MATRLTIDEGNSSTKVAFWRDDVIEAVATHKNASLDLVRQVLPEGCLADSAIVCSVRRRDSHETLEVIRQFARHTVFLDSDTPGPLKIGYRTPGTLGADRIAAATGAAVLFPSETILVVDMGTAITYDVVSDSRFIGGNIAPGIFVRLEALNHFTSALPLVETDGDTPRWGYDTETALRSGAIRGVVGELQYYRHCLAAEHPHPRVILTGGSAELITTYITSKIITEPHLVLIGLNAILKYNETL
ncbi:MAG: type III pantothenate kinase [Muribaculaceae bacterium]|nr:type III pantothenate kinase [Muribaculaceae bacterium]